MQRRNLIASTISFYLDLFSDVLVITVGLIDGSDRPLALCTITLFSQIGPVFFALYQTHAQYGVYKYLGVNVRQFRIEIMLFVAPLIGFVRFLKTGTLPMNGKSDALM